MTVIRSAFVPLISERSDNFTNLSSQPLFGVEFSRFLAQLELEDVVLSYSAQHLTGGDFLALAHAHRLEVTIDGDITAMAHHDHHLTGDAHHRTHLAIKNATYLCTG